MHLSVIELSRSTWETETLDFIFFLFFLRIPCGRTHFNFLFPYRLNLIRNFGSHGRKSRNLVAKYDNKLGQTSTRAKGFSTEELIGKQKKWTTAIIDRASLLEAEASEKSYNLSPNLRQFRGFRFGIYTPCTVDIVTLIARRIYILCANKYLTSAIISESIVTNIFLRGEWRT